MTPADWAAVLAGFRDYLRGLGRRHSTWETYATYLHRLAADHADPFAVDAGQLAAWLDSGVPDWSAHTRRSAAATLRVFYGWAVRAGYLEASPALELVSPVRSSAGDHRAAPVLSAAWGTALDDFEQSLRAAGRAAGTIRLRRWHLGQLGGLYADPYAVSGDDLAAWLSGPVWAPESRKSARASVRVFYRWAAITGRLTPSPAEQLAPVTIPRALPRPASESAIATAAAAATDRDRLMLLLGAFAGLRCMEIARVHPRDVVDGHTLRVTGKGRKQRLVPLHPVISAELDAELARRRAGGHGTGWRWTADLTADGWLFPNARGGPITGGNVGKALSALIDGDWTAHSLRHRFASAAYATARDLRAVQELLGHSKPETTARYTAVPDGALRAAVLGIGGGS